MPTLGCRHALTPLLSAVSALSDGLMAEIEDHYLDPSKPFPGTCRLCFHTGSKLILGVPVQVAIA